MDSLGSSQELESVLSDISEEEEMEDSPESLIQSSVDIINSNEPKRNQYQNIFVRYAHEIFY